MSLTRRTFLTGAAAVPAGFALATRSLAQIALGQATLTTISDGHLVLPGSFLFDTMPQDELLPLLADLNVSPDELTPECNVTLYRDGENTVLFDVGSGPDFMPSAGRLADNLAAANVQPEDVTHVVFTHAHPDHIWGLLDDFGDLLFPEASYLMGRTEWDYWWNPATVDQIGEARAAFAVGAKRRMEIIEDAITHFDDATEILPGITAVASFGHTPGHMSFEVGTSGTSALIVGDVVTNPHVAFLKPHWAGGADQNPEQAADTRLRLLTRLANDQMPIVGFHLPGGGIGRVDRLGEAFTFLPGVT